MSDVRNLVSFTLHHEGGKSSAQTDNARHNPSPCGLKNGYPIHTNKGVQWKTFVDSAAKLGYNPSCENFLKMPYSIWLKIYTEIFWKPMQCDKIDNTGIANIFVTWAWMSGQGTATASLKAFFKKKYAREFSSLTQIVAFVNDLNAKDQNQPLFSGLMQHRKEFLIGIPGSANDAGWLAREAAFYAANLPFVLANMNYILSNRTRKGILYGGILTAIGLSIIAYGKYARTE